MIPRTESPQPASQAPLWRQRIAEAVREPLELYRLLGLDPATLPAAEAAARDFPLWVPHPLIRRMERGNPDDPLLRQVLPRGEERIDHPGFTADPVGDLAARSSPRLLRKYRGRALLITTPACALHCRFCFRRHFPYDESMEERLEESLGLLAEGEPVSEVILSGGDPLTLSDRRLAELAERIERLSAVERLRIHTRLPVVIPERVDEQLLGWLRRGRLRKVVVLHVNHPNELDNEALAAVERLRQAGVTLLNQSVLLRGINDCEEILAALSERLFGAGALPYYLHQLDRARGTAHFEVGDEAARRLVERLRARLPGYLVPRLVREIPGEPSKTPLL
ncbi:EF-P beta-lysylation protein EpmB [Endothiovibrio diazotrophicus]